METNAKKKLSQDYIKDKQIRQYYKYLKALCFVPPSDLIEVFNIISKDAPTAFVPMLVHLEKYYIGKSFSNRPGVRAVPAYPIKFWNCYYRVLNGDARTNNSVEAWHLQFELDVGKHSTMNKLLTKNRTKKY